MEPRKLPSVEKTRSQQQLRLPTVYSQKKKKKRASPCVIRRSERIQNAVLPHQQQQHQLQPVLPEQISVTESDKEDDNNPQPPADPDDEHNNLHTKIDSILKLLQAQQIIINALKPKNDENPLPSTDARYKSLYFESQKKVQALMDENHELTQKLETAVCKVEVYEKGNKNLCEVLEKMKDVILVSNLTKVTETAVNAAIRDAMSPPPPTGTGCEFASPNTSAAAKRKKTTK